MNKGTDIVHALRFDQKATPRMQAATIATWQPEPLKILNSIRNQAIQHLEQISGKKENIAIPSASLRMRMQLTIDSLINTAYQMALTNANLFYPYKTKGKELAVFHQTQDIEPMLDVVIESWLENELTTFIETHQVADHLRESLFDLLDDNAFYKLTQSTWQMFPWSYTENGTAKPNTHLGYSITANEIAQLLEGQAIFNDLPPVKRIIGGGDLGVNSAELMTPIIRDAAEGAFSMVCSISIETLPTVSYPLICIDIHRRRWVTELSLKYTHSKTTSGFLYSKTLPRAYRFSVNKSKDTNGAWIWSADEGWAVLTEKYDLPLHINANDILKSVHEYDMEIGIAFINELEGTNEQGQHDIHVGCTETDRIHVFKNVSAVLAQHSFECFDNVRQVKNPKNSPNLVYLNWKSISNFISEQQVAPLDDNSPIQTVQEQEAIINGVMAHWADAFEVLDDKELARQPKVNQFLAVTQSLASAITNQTGDKVTLLMVLQDVEQQSLIKTIAAKLFGNNIELVTAALPANVHGPKLDLPASNEKDLKRLYERINIWEAFIEQAIQGRKGQILCLIQANQFYGGKQVDDKINKPAAKIAFTKKAHIPVQYVLPVDTRKRSSSKQITDYVHRLQSALLDLYFGHQGLVPKVDDVVRLNMQNKANHPQYLYGIRVLKVNGRTINHKASEIAIASKIDIRTGLPLIKLGHGSSKIDITDWMPFTSAIGYITSKFNHQLTLKVGKGFDSRKQCFQEFFNRVLDEANLCKGMVYVDTVQCRGLCYWLADSGVPHKGLKTINDKWHNLRLIRVRTEQAPEIMVEKYDDEYDAHTSCERLFRVEQGSIPIYWSLGKPMNKIKRGRSVYRNTFVKAKEEGDKTELEALYTKNTATPNAVEYTMLNLIEGDKSDEIAQFTTALRTGVLQANQRWVQLPAPLFIANKLTEYLSL